MSEKAKHIPAEVARQVCFCADPIKHEVRGYGETLLLEQCGRCHKILRQPCPKCNQWTKNLFEHEKVEHPKPRKPRTEPTPKKGNPNGNQR